MSHPHTVPEGWVKGERLEIIGSGPRYALSIAMGPKHHKLGEHLERFPDGGVMITFDSKDDVDAFLRWWYS